MTMRHETELIRDNGDAVKIVVQPMIGAGLRVDADVFVLVKKPTETNWTCYHKCLDHVTPTEYIKAVSEAQKHW